jgi:shikimate dehydrogenase
MSNLYRDPLKRAISSFQTEKKREGLYHCRLLRTISLQHMPHLYGLIGYPLGHSFSRQYFTDKFERERIPNSEYRLFEMPDMSALPALIRHTPGLRGLNVTIPHKTAVLAYLDHIDDVAAAVGAVNTICIAPDGELQGYNTDVQGFTDALLHWLPGFAQEPLPALVLGSGGAAKAVGYALSRLGSAHQVVSRTPFEGQLGYTDTVGWLGSHAKALIVNTTPLGMYPNVDSCPLLPWASIGKGHCVFDLVYNPSDTLLLREAIARGAAVQNGLGMLYAQAEHAWRLWQMA